MEILAGKKTKKKNVINPGKKKREIANTLFHRQFVPIKTENLREGIMITKKKMDQKRNEGMK